jgi:transcriptional regulator of heat shock response
MEIDERKQTILYAVVREFIEHAEPVGSSIIDTKYGIKVSPATIRNEMAFLEEAGYLTHPHTSAGRIPTDKGYRFFVDHLMRQEELTRKENELVKESLKKYAHDVDYIMENTLNVLTTISNYLGVITERVGKLTGKQTAARRLTQPERLHYSGLSHLMSEPEFEDDPKPLRSLLTIFEDKDRVCDLLDKDVEGSNEVIIRIGEENKCGDLHDYSVIAKSFSYEGKPVGTVGVVGPKRMRYGQVASTVQHIAQSLDELLTLL